METIKVFLTRFQRIDAKWLGELYCWSKTDDMMENDYVYDKSGDHYIPHYRGAAGNIAYAHVRGLEVDRTVKPFGDATDFNGTEVKTSTFQGDGIELKITVKNYNRIHKNAKMYILCRSPQGLTRDNFVADCRWIEIIGQITREKFDKVKSIKNYGNRDNYIVGVDQLDPVTWNDTPKVRCREADRAWLCAGAPTVGPLKDRHVELLKEWREYQERRSK